jgi:trigger factor
LKNKKFGATMQISIEKAEGLERNLNVSIPAEKINTSVAEKLKEIAKQVKIKGFRPGKVPKNILQQRYGSHARQEALGDLINTSIQTALKDNNLNIAERPEVTDAKELDDGSYSFVAKLELMPEVPEIDYSKVTVSTSVSEVEDGDVDAMIKKLQKQKQEWKDSKAKIAKGDLVTVEYSAKEGEEQIHPKEGVEKMGILLGESGIPEELVKQIIGMKSGESNNIELDFPDVFNVKQMAGKKLNFDYKITDHKKGKLPKIDEDFVKEFGIESGKEEDLRLEINENLKRELVNTIQSKTRETLLESLRKEAKDIQLSDKMIARESAALAHQSMDQARQMGVENPEHPDHKEFDKAAKERIVNSLIINKISQTQSIQVDYTKVREKIIEIAQTFEDPQQIVEHYYKTPELLSSIENVVVETQVIDWVLSQVNIKEKKVSFDKLMNAVT